MKDKWTRTAPTEPGWYWMHIMGDTECVYVFRAMVGSLVKRGDDMPSHVNILTKNGAWWQPAEVPEPPEVTSDQTS